MAFFVLFFFLFVLFFSLSPFLSFFILLSSRLHISLVGLVQYILAFFFIFTFCSFFFLYVQKLFGVLGTMTAGNKD